MKKVLFATLGTVSLATAGTFTSMNPVQASALGPGTLAISGDGIVYTANNLLDFSPFGPGGAVPNYGTFGTFAVTTPPNNPVSPIPPQSGVFGEFPLTKPGDPGRAFPFTDGAVFDLFISPAAIAAQPAVFPGGIVENNVVYTAAELTGGLLSEVTLLYFDTDNDGLLPTTFNPLNPTIITGGTVDTDDFTYVFDTFVRRVTPRGEAFDVTIEFTGAFIDGAGVYVRTPSVISIFNGTSLTDPEDLSVVANPNLPVSTVASYDATITTVDKVVPEPSTVIGLGVVAGLAGLLRRKRSH